MTNLDIIFSLHDAKQVIDGKRPYEVTQLVNSFLGALVFPWEDVRTRGTTDEPWNLSLEDVRTRYKFPDLTGSKSADTEPKDFRDMIRQLRNGFAHGNIEFYSDSRREIGHIEVWNFDPRLRARTWGAHMTVREMGQFLEAFHAFAKDPLVEQAGRK